MPLDLQSVLTHHCNHHSVDLHRLRRHSIRYHLSTAQDENHQAFHVDSARTDTSRRRITLCLGKQDDDIIDDDNAFMIIFSSASHPGHCG